MSQEKGVTDGGAPAELLSTARNVRDACVEAAVAAYDDAGIRGLCSEGRWEAALGALQALDLRQLLLASPTSPPRRDER